MWLWKTSDQHIPIRWYTANVLDINREDLVLPLTFLIFQHYRGSHGDSYIWLLSIYLRTALHDLNFGYLAQKQFEFTSILQKLWKKTQASMLHLFSRVLNRNIQNELHVFTIQKVVTRVEAVVFIALTKYVPWKEIFGINT